jgi:RHS repeat-associated protein
VRSAVVTRYVYDAAGNLLAEADGQNNITRYYIYGIGLIAMVTPSDQVYCYHFNVVGSTIAMTDQTQAMVNQYAYDPFGNILNQVEAVSQPFKFVGQFGVMTEPNGFYYMRARYYDPQVGRFISEDPVGFDSGDLNLMVYVTNNPINQIDPGGQDFSCGVVVHVETINPITSRGGGIWGYNYQNDVLYSYSGSGYGLDVGGGIESVWAWGSGPWTGEFQSINLGFLWFTGSIFWTLGEGGWVGFSFGLSPKTPIPTAAFEVTNYKYYK